MPKCHLFPRKAANKKTNKLMLITKMENISENGQENLLWRKVL
jgi:hypothetical protein